MPAISPGNSRRCYGGQAPDSLLDSYEIERKPHITELVATTKAIGELDGERARRRDEWLGDAFDRGAAETSRQKFIPDLAVGLLGRDETGKLAPAAGTLFVQPTVKDAQDVSHRLDDLIGECFAVITCGPEPQRWLTGSAEMQWREIGGRRIVVSPTAPFRDGLTAAYVEEGAVLQDWMHRLGQGAIVVRPDKYVFGFAQDETSLQRMVEQVVNAMNELDQLQPG
ncbi:hypothetical protein [Bradyrhizobium sp.]|uniref:hypothetical protein n=1 Tax=Bradyrhizobium sp. TaxID=376 RepID=UPI0025BC3A5D|nr:hypothetical protein [Bradyrhizobium sp.]